MGTHCTAVVQTRFIFGAGHEKICKGKSKLGGYCAIAVNLVRRISGECYNPQALPWLHHCCTGVPILYTARDTHSCLTRFVDLKKLIEHDRKHNDISALSSMLNREDLNHRTYSDRMKTSTPAESKHDTDCCRTPAISDGKRFHVQSRCTYNTHYIIK